MKKPYLLIAGGHYYPDKGTGDWIGCYETREEIENMITKKVYDCCYTINGSEDEYEWYEIVDLHKWTER